MKSIRNNKDGFSFVEIILVLVFIAVIGWLVVVLINNRNESSKSTNTGTTQSGAVEINNAEDLEQAEDTLNDLDLDSLDTTELDAAEEELL